MLVDGSILLTSDSGDLVAVEGLLVKRPSFWTRPFVQVVQRSRALAASVCPSV